VATNEGGELASMVVAVGDGDLVYTVLLSSGAERVHRYHLPAGTPMLEVFQLITDLGGQIWEALNGSSDSLYLQNPNTAYASGHLVGVEMGALGPTELAAEVEWAQRQAGFRPSGDT